MNYEWCQKVLKFCSKHNFEAGKLQVTNGAPYIEIICSDEAPIKSSIKNELVESLPEGSKILYKAGIKKSTKDNIANELDPLKAPWALTVADHVVYIKTMIPKDHEVWDKVMAYASKDKYIKEVKIKVLNADAGREAMAGGSSAAEAEKYAEENGEEISNVIVPVTLSEEIRNNKEKGRFISKDDLLDLKILLNTCSAESLIASL
jgi:hypothetical protein